jgi:hypothetical protein
MQERELPSPPLGVIIVVVIAFAIAAIWAVWLTLRNAMHGMIALVLLGGLYSVTQYFYFHRRRCPECRNRLIARKEYYQGKKYHMWLDCSRCQIAWDTRYKSDDYVSD